MNEVEKILNEFYNDCNKQDIKFYARQFNKLAYDKAVGCLPIIALYDDDDLLSARGAKLLASVKQNLAIAFNQKDGAK